MLTLGVEPHVALAALLRFFFAGDGLSLLAADDAGAAATGRDAPAADGAAARGVVAAEDGAVLARLTRRATSEQRASSAR